MRLALVAAAVCLVRCFELMEQDASSMIQLQQEEDSEVLDLGELQGADFLRSYRHEKFFDPFLGAADYLIEASKHLLLNETEVRDLRRAGASRAEEAVEDLDALRSNSSGPSPILNAKQLHGIVTLTMMSLKEADGTLTRSLKLFDEVQAKTNEEGEKLVELARKYPSHVDAWTPENIKILSNLVEAFESSVKLYAENWEAICNLANKNIETMNEFYTTGPGKALPGGQELASAILGGKTHDAFKSILGPVMSDVLAMTKGIQDQNPNDSIRTMREVKKRLAKSQDFLTEFFKPVFDAEKEHAHDKLIEELKKSILGAFIPPKYTEIAVKINNRFYRSMYGMSNFTSSTFHFIEEAVSTPGLEIIPDEEDGAKANQEDASPRSSAPAAAHAGAGILAAVAVSLLA